jgi:hypothetical protein
MLRDLIMMMCDVSTPARQPGPASPHSTGRVYKRIRKAWRTLTGARLRRALRYASVPRPK